MLNQFNFHILLSLEEEINEVLVVDCDSLLRCSLATGPDDSYLKGSGLWGYCLPSCPYRSPDREIFSSLWQMCEQQIVRFSNHYFQVSWGT